MATMMHLGNMISTNNAGEELRRWIWRAPRKLPMCISMVGRQERLRCDMSFKQGILEEQQQLDVPYICVGGDVIVSVSSDSPRRGRSAAGSGLFTGSEEQSSGGRREFMVWSLLLSTFSTLTSTAAEVAFAAEDTTMEVPLEPYSDAKDGFKLLRPTPWNKVAKPGASIFFEDPKSRNNNIGVTVAPVRIASLDGFGTVDDIVKKLVKAERDKPSTNEMQVINVVEKKLRDNTPLYSLEYILDTTRGGKRILTSVTVAGYKLYILSIVFADGPVAPASSALNDALHQVLNSFDLLA